MKTDVYLIQNQLVDPRSFLSENQQSGCTFESTGKLVGSMLIHTRFKPNILSPIKVKLQSHENL